MNENAENPDLAAKKRKDNIKGFFYTLAIIGGILALLYAIYLYESWQKEKNAEDLKANGRYTIGYYIYTFNKSNNGRKGIHFYYFVNGKYYRSVQSFEDTPNYHPDQPKFNRYFVIFSAKNPHISKFTNQPVPESIKRTDCPTEGWSQTEFDANLDRIMKEEE
jgi:hypothetical protein